MDKVVFLTHSCISNFYANMSHFYYLKVIYPVRGSIKIIYPVRGPIKVIYPVRGPIIVIYPVRG